MDLKKFDRITDALREVKQFFNEDRLISIHDVVFVFYDYYSEIYCVTEEEVDVERYLTNEFYENSIHWTPEEWVDVNEFYVYEPYDNIKKFPNLYSMYDVSCIRAHTRLIRKKKNPKYELSVNFSV